MAQACPSYTHVATLNGANFRIQMSNSGPVGLVQQFGATMQRNISTVYDLASDNIYFVEGQPQGQLQVEKVLGPLPGGSCQGKLLDCTCDPFTLYLGTGARACDNGCQVNFRLLNALQVSFTLQAAVSDNKVRYSAAYTFTGVEE